MNDMSLAQQKSDESLELSTSERTHLADDVSNGRSGILSDLLPIEELLAEQQTLTAVEQFSKAHDGEVPAQAQYYSKLLPATPPQPGEQYAFAVDLDRCSGCKACVTACHSLNGLDENETWRSVGLLLGGTDDRPVMQHVTTACHHCVEPGCLIGCPVNAYEKDPVTGIVKHLDDQCFGCQYCTLACPYEVPQYHADKGIVRKCDMCSDRLTAGEAPACVQACPHEAIEISVVSVEGARKSAQDGAVVPGAPDSKQTIPTTVFRTKNQAIASTLPIDHDRLLVQHAHWPLVVMLVLTQLSVGAFTVGLLFQSLQPSSLLPFLRTHVALSLLVGLAALGASTLHLGRPQFAFRAILGLRHSWLSREILAFGVFAGAALLYSCSVCFAPDAVVFQRLTGWMTVLTGIFGIYCSAKIYDFTKREFWRLEVSLRKFLLTSLVLGIAATWISLSITWCFDADLVDHLVTHNLAMLVWPMWWGMLAKILYEAAIFRYARQPEYSQMRQTARLMLGPLLLSTICRFGCALSGGIVIPIVLLSARDAGWTTLSILLGALLAGTLVFVGEMIERYQFFAASAAPRMPGQLS